MSGEKSSTRPDLHAERELDQGNPLKTSDQASSQRQTRKSLSMGPNYSSESCPVEAEEHSLRCCRVYRQDSSIELFRAFFSEIERLEAHLTGSAAVRLLCQEVCPVKGGLPALRKKLGLGCFLGSMPCLQFAACIAPTVY